MSSLPKTVLTSSTEEDAAIRAAVCNADPATLGPGRVIAEEAHVDAVLELLADPAVSDPIYDLPRPFTRASIAGWIEHGAKLRARGEGLLILTRTPDGMVMGYSKITVWPERASAELGGALRARLQNTGSGGTGAAHTIDWIFATLKVRLICLTAALDNVRSARLIDRMGFVRNGERDAIRPDGTTRRSLYWEMTREDWRLLKCRNADLVRP